jgi:hypothetical protein
VKPLLPRLAMGAALVAAGVGAAVAGYSLLLDRRLEATVTAHAAVDTAAVVSSRLGPADVDSLLQNRERVIRMLWGQPSLPSTPARLVETGFRDPRFRGVPGLRRIDRLEVDMDFGLVTRVHLFQPAVPNGRSVVYHAGHQQDIDDGRDAIAALVEAGYTVAALTMPLQLPNSTPVVDLPRLGPTRLLRHGQMALLQPPSGHPIRYFLEPVIAVTNYLNGPAGRPVAGIVGLSGGGWAVTLVAALDPRVRLSVPVAGSYPLFLRDGPDEFGDWEQRAQELYGPTGYLQLYTLGALEPGRRQVQVINRDDPCCFGDMRWHAYSDSVTARLAALEGGSFSVLMDTTHHGHTVSDAAVVWILELLAAEPAGTPNPLSRRPAQAAAASGVG